jgi:phosphatidylinositol glycan class V
MFLDLSLLPFIHLHTATTLLLLISSHVQIILRLCIVNPVIWWYATDLVLSTGLEGEKRRRWGMRWIWYSVIWGTISIVCWALFLPPA